MKPEDGEGLCQGASEDEKVAEDLHKIKTTDDN